MEAFIKPDKSIELSINNDSDHERIVLLTKALSSAEKIKIIQALSLRSMNVLELARHTLIPRTTVTRHINELAASGLVSVNYQPGPKGHLKLCAKMAFSLNINFEDIAPNYPSHTVIVEMPIGLFSDCNIEAPCGMAFSKPAETPIVDVNSFFLPERMAAECLWFNSGFISYNFPLKERLNSAGEIEFSFELCSEAAYYNANWPSDITVYINDIEVTTFTSPGDFGGRRGNYTPEYWPLTSTQFGLLKRIRVNSNGVYVDNIHKGKQTQIEDLKILSAPFVKLSIGIKSDATHKGGLNLFGKNFGDYPQGIIMSVI